jgi:uncharacterized repeat protein (TIGR04076 family)
MEQPHKVVARILSVRGTCEARHEAGQEFDLSGDVVVGYSGKPNTLCQALYCAIYPSYRTLRFGGTFPWEKDTDVARVACPDPDNPVTVELRRIREV